MRQRPGSAGYINVVTREYDRPDGSTATWDVVEDADAAAVLAFTPGGYVVLVRQFRPFHSNPLAFFELVPKLEFSFPLAYALL